MTADSHDPTRPEADLSLYRRAPWGPLHVAIADDRVDAWVADSRVATIETPACRDYPDPTTLARLADGLPVLLDGEPALTLVQPRRRWLRRDDRVIEVHGPEDLVPPGTVLRARQWYSMGLEVRGPGGRRLVRPSLDLADAPFLWGFTVGSPTVADDVEPDLLAAWGAASWHLLAAVQQ